MRVVPFFLNTPRISCVSLLRQERTVYSPVTATEPPTETDKEGLSVILNGMTVPASAS